MGGGDVLDILWQAFFVAPPEEVAKLVFIGDNRVREFAFAAQADEIAFDQAVE